MNSNVSLNASRLPPLFIDKNVFINALLKTANEGTKVAMTEAKRVFEEKSSSGGSGLLAAAFSTKQATLTGDIVVMSYFVNMAPYAKYVNWDRKLANGKWWSEVNPKAPYLFMEAGMEKAKVTIPKLLQKNLKSGKMIQLEFTTNLKLFIH